MGGWAGSDSVGSDTTSSSPGYGGGGGGGNGNQADTSSYSGGSGGGMRDSNITTTDNVTGGNAGVLGGGGGNGNNSNVPSAVSEAAVSNAVAGNAGISPTTFSNASANMMPTSTLSPTTAGIPSIMSSLTPTISSNAPTMSMPSGLGALAPSITNISSPNAFNVGYTSPMMTAAELPGDTARNYANLNTLNPMFESRAANLLNTAMDAGLAPRLSSTARTMEQQAGMYANRDTNQYPVAPAGSSFHNYGLAMDVGGLSPSQLKQMGAMAQMEGLGWGGTFNDPVHFQNAPANASASRYAGLTGAEAVTASGKPWQGSGSINQLGENMAGVTGGVSRQVANTVQAAVDAPGQFKDYLSNLLSSGITPTSREMVPTDASNQAVSPATKAQKVVDNTPVTPAAAVAPTVGITSIPTGFNLTRMTYTPTASTQTRSPAYS